MERKQLLRGSLDLHKKKATECWCNDDKVHDRKMIKNDE